jgi:hypothetical protein
MCRPIARYFVMSWLGASVRVAGGQPPGYGARDMCVAARTGRARVCRIPSGSEAVAAPRILGLAAGPRSVAVGSVSLGAMCAAIRWPFGPDCIFGRARSQASPRMSESGRGCLDSHAGACWADRDFGSPHECVQVLGATKRVTTPTFESTPTSFPFNAQG